MSPREHPWEVPGQPEPADRSDVEPKRQFQVAAIVLLVLILTAVAAPYLLSSPSGQKAEVTKPGARMELQSDRILGFGLETTSLRIHPPLRESLDPRHPARPSIYRITSELGEAQPEVVIFHPGSREPKEVLLSSRRTGADEIRIVNALSEEELATFQLRHTWQWFILPLGLLGALVGMTQRVLTQKVIVQLMVTEAVAGVLFALIAGILWQALGLGGGKYLLMSIVFRILF